MKLIEYVKKWKDIQRWTWKAHTLIAILGSLLAGALLHTAFFWWEHQPRFLIFLTIGSLIMAGIYTLHEQRDEKMHKEKKKDWYKPDASGVNPISDKAGDLLGSYAYAIGLIVATITVILGG